MWRNVRTRFDARGVTNVVWVMNYMGWDGWQCATRGLWPGNDYVDWVMWDPYPRNATWTTFINSFYNYLLSHNDAAHNFMSKPWGLAEFGFVGTSQTAAYRIYDDLRANLNNGVHSRLKAYVVWDNHTSSSLDDRVAYTAAGVPDPVEQQHYNAFANDPLLVGTGVPEPIDQTPPAVTLSAPEDAATVAGTVAVTGSATDDVGVDSVALLVDGDEVSSASPDTAGAVSFDWNSFTVTNGSHTLRLRAHDAAGNTGETSPVVVAVENVDTEPPSSPSDLVATWGTPSQVSLRLVRRERQRRRHRLHRLSRRRADRHAAGSDGSHPRGPGRRQPDQPQLHRRGRRQRRERERPQCPRGRGDRGRHPTQRAPDRGRAHCT